MTAATTQVDSLRPPLTHIGILGWLRQNLFNTWFNAALTLLTASLLYLVLRPALTWALTEAKWDVVTTNLRLFMLGQYPREAVWRLWLGLDLLGLLVGMSWGVWGRPARAFALMLGAAEIRAGDAEIVIAGGMENMNAAPYLLDRAEWPTKRVSFRLCAGPTGGGGPRAYSG